MSLFCDVALPVPLDRLWTYACPEGGVGAGARVLVPFRNEKLTGIVVRVHGVPPPVEAKAVLAVLDAEPLLPEDLLRLAEWIAAYYLSPLGEVFRTMLPLMAEVRQRVLVRIAEAGRGALYAGAAAGASRRTRLPAEEQDREYAVLNYLEPGEAVAVATLRRATGASRALLDGMLRKRWLRRETEAAARDAGRRERWAVLVTPETSAGLDAAAGLGGAAAAGVANASDEASALGVAAAAGFASALGLASAPGSAAGLVARLPRLTEGQRLMLAALEAGGGAMPAGELRPSSTLGTLVRRGLVRLEERARGFHLSSLTRGKSWRLNASQEAAVEAIAEAGAGAGGGLAVAEGPTSQRRDVGHPEPGGAISAAEAGAGGRLAVAEGPTSQRRDVGHPAPGAAVAGAILGASRGAVSGAAAGAGVAGVGAAEARGKRFTPILLHGVTGSGKTAVYLAAMRGALERGQGSILLVPEIGLTPSVAGQLHGEFGAEVALLHSALTAGERAEQWHRIRRGEARIVVGTRSAVFAPIARLGLVIVDEEHDGSYKQEEMPRYHARDVAVMRAKLLGAVCVLGSATPSLESRQNAERGRYRLVAMRERVAARPLPEFELVDMREEFKQTGREEIFARRLVEETRAVLGRGEQAILLLNRRGYSYVALCRACGEKVGCENCAIALTLHKAALGTEHASAGDRLECHLCGFRTRVPAKCPACGSEHLYYLGAGSQQGEERLRELFPEARIGRMDRDTIRGRHDMERLLGRMQTGEVNLLVGTQMIAKGHDIHGVTLVGVVGCDHALGLPDFRAAERVFQLLTQVAGRAGRGELPGRVLVQTYHGEHYAIACAAAHDYAAFVEREARLRRAMHYPPFAVLANVIVHSARLEEAADWAGRLGKFFRGTMLPGVRVLGPASAPLSKVKRVYRFHLVVKGETRAALHGALRGALAFAEGAGGIPRRNLTLDVDALSLM